MAMKKRKTGVSRVGRVLGRVLLIVAETLLLLFLAAYTLMYILAKGPSPTASRLFVMSVRETSAIGFLANWFFTDEEIAAMSAPVEKEYVPTDTSLVTISAETGAEADAWGLVDEDGDGIIVEPGKGEGYSGFMMIVKDPSRVIMGSDPDAYRKEGFTVAEFVEKFDGVAAINAGGFYDPDGQGDGSIPDSVVVYDGEIYYPEFGCREGFVGMDSNYILHVADFMSVDEIRQNNIQYGVCFGPVLVQNGQGRDASAMYSGLNPRTAIGQRSDGAILLLVIDGRQAISMGASYADEMEIMLRYGAVNACNLDGGSSTLLWFQGGYINNCASVIGIRDIPTSWVVLKEGRG